MTGRCTGGQHHAPTSGACPCGTVSRHPVAVPVRAGDEAIETALAIVVARRVYAEGPDGEVDPVALVRALLPTVRRIAEQRAAEELRAASAAYWRDVDFPVARVPEVRDWLRDRAAALTATPNHGTDVTT